MDGIASGLCFAPPTLVEGVVFCRRVSALVDLGFLRARSAEALREETDVLLVLLRDKVLPEVSCVLVDCAESLLVPVVRLVGFRGFVVEELDVSSGPAWLDATRSSSISDSQ